MFNKKKDKEIDITSLNEVIHIGKRFMNIAYFMAIVAVILLGTYGPGYDASQFIYFQF